MLTLVGQYILSMFPGFRYRVYHIPASFGGPKTASLREYLELNPYSNIRTTENQVYLGVTVLLYLWCMINLFYQVSYCKEIKGFRFFETIFPKISALCHRVEAEQKRNLNICASYNSKRAFYMRQRCQLCAECS